MRALLLFALALAPFAPASAAGVSGEYKGYNVILISITNVGDKHMSLFGYGRPTTPKLSEWAKDAFVFDHAYTHASWTLPVAVSLFTSLYPYTHRVLRRDLRNALEDGIKTLPEILRDHGYRTAAFTGGLDYYPGFSHMRGFQEAPENPNYSGFRVTAPEAAKWLAAHRREKFFMFLHSYDAHCPFVAHPPFKGRFADAKGKALTIDPSLCVRGMKSSQDYTAMYAGGCPQFPKAEKCSAELGKPVRLTQDDIDFLAASYDEKVLEEDSLLGDFLSSLDAELLKKTIVVVYSEHGEMFAKHGRFGRAGTRRGTLYDDVLNVPLLIKLPGAPGRRVGRLVQLVDVMPTLLDALGIPAAGRMQGVSLAPLLDGGDEPVHEYVYAGAPYNLEGLWDGEFNLLSRGESVRDARWKLIHEVLVDLDEAKAGARTQEPRDRIELYDVAADPDETRDVSAAHPDVAARLRGALEDWSKAASSAAETPATRKAPPELLRKAREYGYWQ